MNLAGPINDQLVAAGHIGAGTRRSGVARTTSWPQPSRVLGAAVEWLRTEHIPGLLEWRRASPSTPWRPAGSLIECGAAPHRKGWGVFEPTESLRGHERI